MTKIIYRPNDDPYTQQEDEDDVGERAGIDGVDIEPGQDETGGDIVC